MIVLKTAAELAALDRANHLVHEALTRVVAAAVPGVSTWELDALAEEHLGSRGGRPAFKGYRGYPATICTSVNDAIVHGIPSRSVKLLAGDVLSVDCGVVLDGFVGDAAVTVPIGDISPTARQLLQVTRECLERAVEVMRPGKRLGDVGHAVQAHAEAHGYAVVRDFCGHGIGRAMHEEPSVPNYGPPGRGPELRPGLVLAIEPMINLGKPGVIIDPDGWTARTEDGKLSAHFEYSVAVTDDGPWVLGVDGR
ncbi:MAG: type I methionyl aminopeptidase [Thermoanaerobaculaceae bacterium]|nr:type I methionyl aminopeptidase [Thermoanaerobaculaceae bacterium]MDI9622310.1 type I methionyl aminopeptidase [Acidobacteriota bacterium]NLH10614.1 type I methionyl aminopeptidase [Holophagae bacterium]